MPLVRVQGTGQVGLNKDLSQHELPINAWSDCQNIRFLDGYANQFTGHSETYASPSYEPQHVLPVTIGSAKYWIYPTATKTFAVSDTTGSTVHTDITHATPRAGVVNNWTSCVLSGIPILNAGDTSYPMAWDLNLTHKFVDLTAWPVSTSCKAMRSYKTLLVALNVTKSGTNYPYMVKWSHPADPGSLPSSWDATDATKLSGEIDLAEGGDEIIDGMELRGSFMIYKERSIWRMDGIGQQFTKVFGNSGAMNRNCIVDIDGYHIVLTNDDIIRHDGNSSQSILDKVTRRWLFQNIDVDNYAKAFLFKNPFFNECYICYPSIGASVCDSALVYNYRDQTVSQRQLPNINHAAFGPISAGFSEDWDSDNDDWDTDLTVWDAPGAVPNLARVIMASSDIKLYLLDGGSSFNGTSFTAYIERRGLSFGAPETIKLIRGIRARITGQTGYTVLIEIGSQNDPWDEPTYATAMTHTIGSQIADDCFVTGRYIAIKISTGTAAVWRLDSFDFDLHPSGSW